MTEPGPRFGTPSSPGPQTSGYASPLRLRKTAETYLPETLIKWFAVFLAAAVFSLAG